MSVTPIETTIKPEKKKQGRIHRKPENVKKIYPLEVILEGEQILIALDKHRFLTNGQIGELQFRRRIIKGDQIRSEKEYQETANKQISRLIDAEYVERIQIFQTHPVTGNIFQGAVNILTLKGKKVVESVYHRNDDQEETRWTSAIRQYSNRKIDHELGINDMAIMLNRSVGSLGHGYELYEWHDDDQLKQVRHQTLFNTFIPDFFCVIGSPDGRYQPIFGEYDRGTEVVNSRIGSDKDWKTKVIRYVSYIGQRYYSDPYWKHLGFDPEAMAAPIVLSVTTSPERLGNMLTATHEADGRSSYLYTSRDQLYSYGTDLKEDQTSGAKVRLRMNWDRLMLEPIWVTATKQPPRSLRSIIDPQPVGVSR